MHRTARLLCALRAGQNTNTDRQSVSMDFGFQVQLRGCCCAKCMKHSSAGDTCKNAQFVDDWVTVKLVPKNDETREVMEELRGQDLHESACEMLSKGDVFAVCAPADDENHTYYLAQAVDSVQNASCDEKDDHGSVVSQGGFYVPCHYLEWSDTTMSTYYVDHTKLAKLDSHLVIVSRIEMLAAERGCWKISPEEDSRVQALVRLYE